MTIDTDRAGACLWLPSPIPRPHPASTTFQTLLSPMNSGRVDSIMKAVLLSRRAALLEPSAFRLTHILSS